MSASARSTITLPKVRLQQLELIAQKHDLPNPAALIEAWIGRAVSEGDIENVLPGFSCQVVGDNKLLITLAGHALPLMAPDRARMLAAILSSAAGETDPKLPFEMPSGRPLVADIGNGNKVLVGRIGRGIRVFIQSGPSEVSDTFATSPAFVAELANMIRTELGE